MIDDHVCPECTAGKHRDCDGTAFRTMLLGRPRPCICWCQVGFGALL